LYKPYSERTAQLIDGEAEAIVSSHYERALTILRERKSELHALAEALLAKEVIEADDLIEILGPRPFGKSTDYEDFVNASWKPGDNSAATDAGAQPAAGLLFAFPPCLPWPPATSMLATVLLVTL